jgi:hypothetical protein
VNILNSVKNKILINNLLDNRLSIIKDEKVNNNFNLISSNAKTDDHNLFIVLENIEKIKLDKNDYNPQPYENLITSNSLEDELKKFYKNINLNNVNHDHTNSYKNLRYDLDQGSLEIIKENASNEDSKYTNPNTSKDKSIEYIESKNNIINNNRQQKENVNCSNYNKNEEYNFKSAKTKVNNFNIAESIDINNLNYCNNNGGSIDDNAKNVNISNINNSYNSINYAMSDNKNLLSNFKNNPNASYKESFSVAEISK